MTIVFPKKKVVRRCRVFLQLFFVFAASLVLPLQQIIGASSSSMLDVIANGDPNFVDYPLPSFPVSRSQNISLLTAEIGSTLPDGIPGQEATTASTREVPTDDSETNSRCQSMHDWFGKPHWENVDLDQQFADTLIGMNPLSNIDNILGQTICHKEGKFRQAAASFWNVSDSELLSEWEFKLTYLAIHDFHHRPAREERLQRSNCSNHQAFPSFSYKCREAKFLVSSVPGIGMGASVRLAAVNHAIVAIANDRIPLFIENVEAGPPLMRKPAQLFSCDRRDPQCIFLPTTPCTLLLSDLNESTIMLDEKAERRVLQKGFIPEHFSQNRTLYMKPSIFTASFEFNSNFMNGFRKKVQERAVKLINEWQLSVSPHDNEEEGEELATKAKFLHEAAQGITTRQRDMTVSEKEKDIGGVYNFVRRYNRISHAIVLYLLRPNPGTQATLRQELKGILPISMDPETSIGLPIRGSDKCGGESTCLAFEKYMQLAKETWETRAATITTTAAGGKHRGTLIMTTEDRNLFVKRLLYNEESGFPLDIVVNDKDPLQGTGFAKRYGESADHIMISSILALQMQLGAGHIYGNCCSNFHTMLFDFAHEGCGVTTKATCLQETKKYKVCCMWDSGNGGCDTIREEHKLLQSQVAAEEEAMIAKMAEDLKTSGF